MGRAVSCSSRFRTALVLIGIGCFCGAALPQLTSDEFTRVAWLFARQLSGPDDAAARDAMSAFRRINELVIPELLKVAETDTPKELELNDRRVAAVRLLADLHAPEAIPILVRRIEMGPPPAAVVQDSSFLGRYPYASALVSYRHAATPELLGFLRRSRNQPLTDRAVEIYAHVLIACAGRHWAYAENVADVIPLLEREIAATPENHRGELNRVLNDVQKIGSRLKSIK
jgi:hypothetical protein